MDCIQIYPDYYRMNYWLRTPSYNYPGACADGSVGFLSEKDKTAFYDDCARIFEHADWQVYAGCNGAIKGSSTLDFHPQVLSGIVKMELIGEVTGIIAKAKTFQLVPSGVQRVFPLYNLSINVLLECLMRRRKEIEDWMLKKFTRRHNYVRFVQDEISEFMLAVVDKFGARVMNQEVRCEAADYVRSLFDNLVASGRIIREEDGRVFYYRTALKSELKEKKHGKSPD